MQVLIVTHSWGETLGRNFLFWVDRQEVGWTEKHVSLLFNIAGCPLGVPKVKVVKGSMWVEACVSAKTTNLQHWVDYSDASWQYQLANAYPAERP